MRIAVDAMGGDWAPYEVVKGAVKAAATLDTDISSWVTRMKSRTKAGWIYPDPNSGDPV